MKLSVRNKDLDRDGKKLEELRDKLAALEYDIDQPYWMASKEFISSKMLEKLHVLNMIRKEDNND